MPEFMSASRLGLPAIKLWAYDHLCLFGWPVPLPTTDDRSSPVGFGALDG